MWAFKSQFGKSSVVVSFSGRVAADGEGVKVDQDIPGDMASRVRKVAARFRVHHSR